MLNSILHQSLAKSRPCSPTPAVYFKTGAA